MGKRLSGEGSSARPSRLVPELSVRKYLQTPSPLTSKSIFEPAGGQGNASGPSRFRPPRPVRSAAPETETLSPLGPQRPLPTPAGWDNIPLDLYSAPFRLSATQQTDISSISGRLALLLVRSIRAPLLVRNRSRRKNALKVRIKNTQIRCK